MGRFPPSQARAATLLATRGAVIREKTHQYMKRTFLSLVLLCLGLATAQAQVNNACPGLHNPTNFNSTPGGAGSWSARVGDRVQGSGGSTGTNILSTCARANKTPIRGAQILSSYYYSGYCQYTCGAYPGTGCAHTFSDANDHRFTIYTAADAGLDEFTINSAGQGMQRIPPNHSTSIRLGDMRSTGTCVSNINTDGNNKGSEALFYTMRVNSQNALLFIDYAVVARKYAHTAQQAGEFTIRVVGKNANGQWNNAPLTPALFYNVPAPDFSVALPAPWIEGRPGGSSGATYCGYCYKDWTRVAISLIDYIYDSVRVEMYTSDCIYNVDPIYAYIAGDCQPMVITASGCPGGASDAVDTLRAPEGLLSYTWYVADNGYSGNTSSSTEMASVPFRLVASTSTANTYVSRLTDFVTNTGDTVGTTTYKCVMTSAMNPSMPFESTVYATVSNTKPIINANFTVNCDSTISFEGLGRVPYQGQDAPTIVDSSTTWTIHDGSADDTPVIGVVRGQQARFRFSNSRSHAVTLSMYTQDTTCYTSKTFIVQPLMPPNGQISIDKRTLCVGDTATLTDLTSDIVARRWEFANDTIEGLADNGTLESTRVLRRTFDQFENPFMLITTNQAGCSDTLRDTVYFFHDPQLTYSPDTIVCNGHQTSVSVSTPVPGCSFEWYLNPSQAPVCTGSVLMVRPTQPTTTYYLKVTASTGCVVWDSLRVHLLTTSISATPSNGRICPDSTATLTGSGAQYYLWYAIPADSSLNGQEHNQTIYVSPTQDTRYYLIGYAADSCDVAAINFLVQPAPVPVLNFEYSPHYIDTEIPVVNFTDLSLGRDHTQWLFGDGGTSTGQSVTHHFDIYSPLTNSVTLRSYNIAGCHADTTFWIEVDTFGFYRPNVFTPNKGENNRFYVVCPSSMDRFHIAIYNRSGMLVYESDDPHFQWDGSHNGTALPTGAYPYVITYTRAGSTSITRVKGTVLLLR